jgi:glycosyltransferase involved in cell wall biosynthesis
MKPKLTIVTPIFPPDVGGPASYTTEIATRLQDDFEITILGFCGGMDGQTKTGPKLIPGTKSHFINPHAHSFLGRQKGLRALLNKHAKDADFIYIQGPIVTGVNARIFASKHKIPHAMKFVGDIAWEDASRRGKTQLNLPNWLASSKKDLKARLIYWLQKWNFQKAQALITPSKFLKNILTEYYKLNPAKVNLIFNAFDAKITPRTLSEPATQLMTAGRLVPHKNVAAIIKALHLLPETYTLDIYGGGPELDNLKNLAAQLDLTTRTTFHGNVPQASLHQAMTEHDAFILYSNYEGLPHIVLESFAKSCPVIASDIPGTNEVAIHQKTALLAPPNNPAELAKTIKIFTENHELRQTTLTAGQNLLQEKFSWENHLTGLRKIIQQA